MFSYFSATIKKINICLKEYKTSYLIHLRIFSYPLNKHTFIWAFTRFKLKEEFYEAKKGMKIRVFLAGVTLHPS